MVKSGIIVDDSYIVTWQAAKAYADGVQPGVRIIVEGCDTP
jgi:hypothetical protein